MQRDEFRCQCCGAVDKTLNVHHLEYHKKPWDTPLCSLETLCEPCHETRTELNKKLKKMSSYTLDKVMDLARSCACEEVVRSARGVAVFESVNVFDPVSFVFANKYDAVNTERIIKFYHQPLDIGDYYRVIINRGHPGHADPRMLMSRAEVLGSVFECVDGKIRFDAPTGPRADALIEDVRANRDALIAHLNGIKGSI
jgi:hypothetical protein